MGTVSQNIELRLVNPKLRVWQLVDGLLILERDDYRTWPVQVTVEPHPAGWRWAMESWWYGRSVANFLWRNRNGFSSCSPTLIQHLQGQ